MKSNNAGFGIRLFSTLIDSLIEITLFVLGLYSFVLMLSIDNFVASTLNFVLYIILFIFSFGILRLVYSIYFISIFGGTLGKLIFNLKIVDQQTEQLISKKRAFYRLLIGYAFSVQFIGLGFFRIIKNSNKLGWHDELFNTKVIVKGSPYSGVVMFVSLLLLVMFLMSRIVTSLENSKYLDYVTGIIQSTKTIKETTQEIEGDINSKNDTIRNVKD